MNRRQFIQKTTISDAAIATFDHMNHSSYDFGKSVNLFEAVGYEGIYSLEQWGKPNPAYDDEKITDWMIAEVQEYL